MKGVAWVSFLGSLVIMICGVPLFALLHQYAADPVMTVLVAGFAFGAFGAISGNPPFLYVVELFPVRVRARAMGISYNCGIALFCGLLPAVSQASLEVSPL